MLDLGPLTFCRDKQILRLGSERIELSAKESKLLNVLASAPNAVINREQLMEQVWGEEGAFVGRSLDVFVSRLRKKLQPASTVRIVSSHGRGISWKSTRPAGQYSHKQIPNQVSYLNAIEVLSRIVRNTGLLSLETLL